MLNSYIPKFAKIINIEHQTADVKLFTFAFAEKNDRVNFSFTHGQFLMLGLLGQGEAAFDICSAKTRPASFQLAIRRAGGLTAKLHELKIGERVTVRGPFGNGWPEKIYQGKDLILIGGGTGFIVFRSLVLDYLAGKSAARKISLFYGCLNEVNMLFRHEFPVWKKKISLEIACAAPGKLWQGATGLVTSLFKPNQDFADTIALVVGPPAMYRPVIAELKKRGMADQDIFVSLERRMYCGIGVCQHCAIGPYYVCKDGPVFSWAQLKDIPGAV